MRHGTGPRRLSRAGVVGVLVLAVLSAATFAAAGQQAATPTVKSFAPRKGSVGTKITIKGTDFGVVTASSG